MAAMVLIGISGYAFFESRNLLDGPIITIEKPLNGSVSNSTVTDIKGTAKNIVRISMNDRDISINEFGIFNEKFVLSVGSNLVKIEAEDRFGRHTAEFVQVLYNEPGPPLVRNTGTVDYQ